MAHTSLVSQTAASWVRLLALLIALLGQTYGGIAATHIPISAKTACRWHHGSPLSVSAPPQLRQATCPQPASNSTDNLAPWSHPPYCATTPYCAFTAGNFQSQGVSIVALPEAISSMTHLVSGALAQPQRPTDRSPPWKVVDIPGAGKGVLATRLLKTGDVIMVDHAAVLADTNFPGRVKRDLGRLMLTRAMEQLAEPERVFGLATSSGGQAAAAEDILRTNTFGIRVDGADYMALFPTISRINHGCAPTSFTRFSETTFAMRVVAFHDIQPGEEITLSYTEFGLTKAVRQSALLRRWGFTCSCKLCSSPPSAVEASDDRRHRIASLRDDVLRLVGKQKYTEAIASYEELVDLVEEERLLEHRGEHYEVMARLYLMVKDMANSEKYARLALADLEQFGGPEVYDSVVELRTFVKGLAKVREMSAGAGGKTACG